jgi:hypothetical protein
MLTRVISGGQIGVEQAAWHAARAAGIPTGGAMPLGFLTDEGPRPDFAAEFGAREVDRPGYAARIEVNVHASDGTLWFGSTTTADGWRTFDWCENVGKPTLVVPAEGPRVLPSRVARWIITLNVRVLNVSGNRGLRVETFLAKVFRITQR